MTSQLELAELRETAKKLSGISPSNKSEMGMMGFAVGAVYALRKAINYGFVDRTGQELPPDYTQELQRIAARLASTDELTEIDWLSGFYFNSALKRLDGLNDRLDKYIGLQRDLGGTAREEVNRLMHDVSGVLSGRTVTLSDAITVLSRLVATLDLACTMRET